MLRVGFHENASWISAELPILPAGCRFSREPTAVQPAQELPDHVCPGIRIHAIDLVQPPGIAAMDAHQTIVAAAPAAKSSAETPKKARWEARSEAMGREISGPAVAPR